MARTLSPRRLRKSSPDFQLFIVVVALIILGVIFLSSASSVISFKEYNDSRYMFLKQVVGIIIGFLLMGAFYKIDIKNWKRFSLPLMIFSVVTLVAVFIPGLGVEHGGAKRWIDIGPIQLQPSEFLKFSIIIYLATLFEKRGQKITDLYEGLLPFLGLVILMSILLITEPDLGTLLVIISIAGTMYFISGAKKTHFIGMVLGGVSAIITLIKISPYRMQRFLVFMNPDAYLNTASGYQTKQALIAIGSGGLLGRGFGKSLQKYQYLPEASTDSIFAIITEERGLIGALIIFGLFAMFGFIGFRIAKNAGDVYSRLLALGITSWVVFQAFLNISATLSLTPLTGVTLPFISFGGTSIVVVIASCGILLNISKNSQIRSDQ